MAAQDLCTLADVRAAAETPTPDTSRDPEIQALITVASDAIMDEVDREFAPASTGVTRRLRVDHFGLSLAPYDLRSASAVTLHPEAASPTTLIAGTDYELTPTGSPSGTYTSVRFSGYLGNLLTSDHAFRFGYAQLDITGNWGFATVPSEVNRACVLTVVAWIRRDISALAQANEFEGAAAVTPTPFGIPYEARRLLTSFYRLQSMVF